MENIIDYVVVVVLVIIVARVLINLKKNGVSCGGNCDGCKGCSVTTFSRETEEERKKRRLAEYEKMGKFR